MSENLQTQMTFNVGESLLTQFPQLTMSWIYEVEIATLIDDLVTSQSIEGTDFPDFEMQDAKIASALRRIISSTSFRRRVSVEEQRAKEQNRFFRGRQIAYMIYGYFQATGAYDAARSLSDQFNMCSHDDDVQDFDTRGDQALLITSEIPQENVRGGSYKMKLRGSVQFQTALAMYDPELDRHRALPSCQRLKTNGKTTK